MANRVQQPEQRRQTLFEKQNKLGISGSHTKITPARKTREIVLPDLIEEEPDDRDVEPDEQE